MRSGRFKAGASSNLAVLQPGELSFLASRLTVSGPEPVQKRKSARRLIVLGYRKVLTSEALAIYKALLRSKTSQIQCGTECPLVIRCGAAEKGEFNVE